MRKILPLTLAIFFLIAPAGCGGDDSPPEITGLIFDMEGGRILVVQGIEDAETSYDNWYDAGNRAVWFAVSGDTEIRRDGKKVSPEALEIGQTVEVWAVGPLMESYPEQGEARKIVILEDQAAR